MGENWPTRLLKTSKYFTPSRTVMSTPGQLCKPPANKIVEPLTFTTEGRWGRWHFPNKISLVNLFEFVLNRQIHVWEKPSNKEEHALPAYFSERWVNHEPLSPSARCFILLSEHSQVLTFFGPGFPLLCFMHFFLNNSRGFYILTWYFVKRNPGVKGILESLSTFNVNRTDLIWLWPSYSSIARTF